MTGIYLRSALKSRVVLIEKLILMLEFTEQQLNYLNTDINCLFELLTNQNELKQLTFIDNCFHLLQSGKSFETSWNESLNGFVSPLEAEDLEILLFFGSRLGKTDLPGQINNCVINRQRLEYQLENANKKLDKFGNLSLKLSLLSGVFLIIIFI